MGDPAAASPGRRERQNTLPNVAPGPDAPLAGLWMPCVPGGRRLSRQDAPSASRDFMDSPGETLRGADGVSDKSRSDGRASEDMH
jgi:hypothetical protein